MRVVIVGGGLIGLSVAWRASQAGVRVTLLDETNPHASSRVGAGLLIAAGGRISPPHFRLKKASQAVYSSFVEELEQQTGLPCGYNPCGTLTVCFEPGAANALDGLSNCLRGVGVITERLSTKECLAYESALSAQIGGGFLTCDHQIDPLQLMTALRMACRQQGVVSRQARVERVGERAVHLSGGELLRADKIVLACGAWTDRLVKAGVYPVKGEVIEFQGPPHLLRGNIIVQRESLYVANRGDGRLVVGATEEEVGFHTASRGAEALYDKVCKLVPALVDHPVVRSRVGFRPKIASGLPLLGDLDGVVMATGHYRNGIQLAPITGRLIADYLLSEKVCDLMRPFLPQRGSRL